MLPWNISLQKKRLVKADFENKPQKDYKFTGKASGMTNWSLTEELKNLGWKCEIYDETKGISLGAHSPNGQFVVSIQASRRNYSEPQADKSTNGYKAVEVAILNKGGGMCMTKFHSGDEVIGYVDKPKLLKIISEIGKRESPEDCKPFGGFDSEFKEEEDF